MINFRYHVVSLTAVFLALAIGLVVGTAALNGPAADLLKDRVDALSKDNSNYREQANQYREELNRSEEFATEVAPALLGGKLAGRKIVVVVLPSGKDHAEGVTSMLKATGATITGQVTVQDKFLDPANATELLELTEKAPRPTVSIEGLPHNIDAVETASALLARALLLKTDAVAEQDLTAVLSAYTTLGYLGVTDDIVPGAEATVVVSGLPPVDREAGKKNQNAVTLTNQFVNNRPLVVAGNGTQDGNLVAEVRGDPTLVTKVSTVDNASTAQGQLATALTAIERIAAGKVGQYGLNGASRVPKAAS
ncbi:copper transporter [Couchioplanes caeruleus]|uniref:Channel-forming protein n=2 Tax=Couchioplanes caeruleus TaxID=56438 RepID=A0A1K0GLI5_9ACTN|nr:copper transporter [Couchioplanes caeruleus]OJF13174.1 channel-forming protein [Couchioplanes caeruleus subsp. caeruleus]ROP33384.1 copper transport outer membrane protein MctB [Couchioplanes caeruleus]